MGGGEEFREEEERPGARADAAVFLAANPAVTMLGDPFGRQIWVTLVTNILTEHGRRCAQRTCWTVYRVLSFAYQLRREGYGWKRRGMTRQRGGSSCRTRSGRKEEERPQKGATSEEMGILFVLIALVFFEYVMSISSNC